ncbi:MarR family transcriptional regulator [Marinicauda algicola]|uniref:MarR family transcriptional regulator n=1 Tax=Marinicauda algicola TaxID=2029849 RepID=A0A4S2H3B3_9PROT|nr:MarR family transcriptional regulator [Marinicauda algicola]TGY90120.1 MarR family transcriptional regulator [Marinicauda algicola]
MNQTDPDADEIAARLHSAAIHLLRRLRREDDASGLSAPQLSALSVVVHAGPLTLAELAGAEQVRPASMSATVSALLEAGLVARSQAETDRRAVSIAATAQGRALLEEGRRRRTRVLAEEIEMLGWSGQRRLAEVLPVLERLARGPG